MSNPAWDKRAQRARELAQKTPAASQILTFCANIVTFQTRVYQELSRSRKSSLSSLIPHLRELLGLLPRIGTAELTSAAHSLAEIPSRWDDLLAAHWESTTNNGMSDPKDAFVAYTLLQPYAEILAERNPAECKTTQSTCPFCQRRPVVSVLRGEGDGAKRNLLCFLCGTEWAFRRLLCAKCGEEDRDKLPVFTASDFDYVRVEACESCHTYIKAIDLTKNGLAVPVIDEVAALSLDIWAQQQGYSKLQPNLFGL
jgi:FdhE protein